MVLTTMQLSGTAAIASLALSSFSHWGPFLTGTEQVTAPGLDEWTQHAQLSGPVAETELEDWPAVMRCHLARTAQEAEEKVDDAAPDAENAWKCELSVRQLPDEQDGGHLPDAVQLLTAVASAASKLSSSSSVMGCGNGNNNINNNSTDNNNNMYQHLASDFALPLQRLLASLLLRLQGGSSCHNNSAASMLGFQQLQQQLCNNNSCWGAATASFSALSLLEVAGLVGVVLCVVACELYLYARLVCWAYGALCSRCSRKVGDLVSACEGRDEEVPHAPKHLPPHAFQIHSDSEDEDEDELSHAKPDNNHNNNSNSNNNSNKKKKNKNNNNNNDNDDNNNNNNEPVADHSFWTYWR
ncbi:unnamed protein product [Polarella glacialis]|uniref:Uncharacterized protein n=1 Tax=Polarella glacialis TaxID=89957 RepID=A0A813KAA2_POLGL|nr:unnamed protein product [Polarella glacialis]